MGVDNNNFYIKGNDEKDIYVYYWNTTDKPKAIIQVFHGMAEHAGRYEEFAEYMNSKGVTVYANDHRGHGKTAGKLEEVGYVGDDGFNRIVDDELLITNKIKETCPGVPIIIYGQGFGAFVAQEYAIKYGTEVEGIILSGSTMMKGPQTAVGVAIAAITKGIFGERKKSYLLNSLSFCSYNKRIENPASSFEWLSRDKDEVKKYDDDPYCGTVFSAGFYYYLFKGLSTLYREDRQKNIPKELSILIISGDQDPVGKYGIKVEKLYQYYLQTGLKNVEMKLYRGSRHMLLNETCRGEVIKDICDWINKRIPVLEKI